MANAGVFAGIGGGMAVFALVIKLISAGVNVSELEKNREKQRRARSAPQFVIPKGMNNPPPTSTAPRVPSSQELQRRAMNPPKP